MPFLGNVWTISFDSCTWSAWRLVSLPKHDWSKYVLHCRFVRKGVTPHLPFIYNIGNNKEWPLPHPMVPENQRCCGGTHCGNRRCSIGRRATGWLKSGRRDRDRAPSHPSRFSWGGRFSALKQRMRFFSPQIAVVFSREHMYFSPERLSFFSWCKLTKFSQLSD